MFVYVVLEAIVGIIAGIFIAIRSKKAENVIYGKLDRAGVITNVILLVVYCCISPVIMLLGMLSEPDYEGFLGILGWIVSVVIASATLFCGLGLGFSVSLRKKGESKLSFALQFAGLAAMVLSALLFVAFYGNLLTSIN